MRRGSEFADLAVVEEKLRGEMKREVLRWGRKRARNIMKPDQLIVDFERLWTVGCFHGMLQLRARTVYSLVMRRLKLWSDDDVELNGLLIDSA